MCPRKVKSPTITRHRRNLMTTLARPVFGLRILMYRPMDSNGQRPACNKTEVASTEEEVLLQMLNILQKNDAG